MVVEFTVKERRETQSVLASSGHLLCFIHPLCCLALYYHSNGPIAEQEAETNSRFSHVEKHCF